MDKANAAGPPVKENASMPFILARAAHDAMLAAAKAQHPRECCGILLGGAGAVDAAVATGNVHPDPHTHFEIDPIALIAAHKAARNGGPGIVGYYHSHPHGPAEPSATDRKMAAHDGLVWAIAGQAGLRCWRDDPGGFVPLPYRLVCS